MSGPEKAVGPGEALAMLERSAAAINDMLVGISVHNRMDADAPARRHDIQGPIVAALGQASADVRAVVRQLRAAPSTDRQTGDGVRAALEQEIAGLKRERLELTEERNRLLQTAAGAHSALEPFVMVAEDRNLRTHSDSYAPRPSRGRPNMGDYRRALAAYNAEPVAALRPDTAPAPSAGPVVGTEVNERLGFWLSAALHDPNTCAEMKCDIEAWFETQFAALSLQPSGGQAAAPSPEADGDAPASVPPAAGRLGDAVADALETLDTVGMPDTVAIVRDALAASEARVVAEREQADAEAAVEIRALIRGFVGLLETGRDRIIMQGGTCDPVDVMEEGSPVLRRAKAWLAARAASKNASGRGGVE